MLNKWREISSAGAAGVTGRVRAADEIENEEFVMKVVNMVKQVHGME